LHFFQAARHRRNGKFKRIGPAGETSPGQMLILLLHAWVQFKASFVPPFFRPHEKYRDSYDSEYCRIVCVTIDGDLDRTENTSPISSSTVASRSCRTDCIEKSGWGTLVPRIKVENDIKLFFYWNTY
jgi:hypothetical protein